MASGSAIARAITAASSVPNTSGPTYARKLARPFRSPGPAVRPGMPSTVRKIATPASATRMARPAARVRLAKTRSPKRRLGDPVSVVTVVTKLLPRASLGLDRVDDLLGLALQSAGERSGAGVVGRLLLARGADNVLQEALDQIGLAARVGRAGDEVRRQHERVGAGLGRGPVDLDRQVARRAGAVERRDLERLGGAVGRRCHVGAADLDRGGRQAADLALVGVPDAARA